MPFQPHSGAHAIVEVVFGVTFLRPFSPPEISAVMKAQDRWKDELPRFSQGNVMEIVFGDGPLPPAMAPTPGQVLDFSRMKPDGNLAWRLHVEGNSIFVNCLEYDRWMTVWPRARRLLQECADVIGSVRGTLIKGTIFQVIDSFRWTEDESAYDAKQLFRSDSGLMGAALLESGPYWHQHFGRFIENGLPENGQKILERVNINCVAENKVPTARMDIYLDLSLRESKRPPDFFQQSSDVVFSYLHDRNKELVQRLITEEVARRIGLNA